MSAVLMTALLAEAVSLVLLRHRLGRTWLRRPVTVLVLVSVACQGLPAVLLAFPSVEAQDIYRNGIPQHFTDEATLIMSAGMLALTVTYLMTHPERSPSGASAGDVRAVMAALDWRILALACAPLAVLTYEGRGYNDSIAINPATPVATVLASSFFVILLALASFAYVLRHGRFLPVLAAQSLLLAAAGERIPVLADAAVLIVLLCRAGSRPSSRQLQAAAALTVAAMLAITGVRVAQGRALFYQDSGLNARVTALGSGFTDAGGASSLVAQVANRLDGDAFAGGILQAISMGTPRLSPVGVPDSLLAAVPSALWAGKAGHFTGSLDPTLTELDDFGLQQVNFLPDLTGIYMGYLSPLWLIAFLAILGAVLGRGERWLLLRCTPARLVLLAGAVTFALDFQEGLPGMLLDLRTAALAALAVRAVQIAPRWRKNALRRREASVSRILSRSR